MMEQVIEVDTGAEALLALFEANGVDYIFLNPGTDTYTVQEAIAKFNAKGRPAPEVILCLHESMAMAAAHGYFMITGKPQVVLVHADLGVQQVGGALHNAQRGRAGVILCSGRVPANIETNRNNQVHWMQEQLDQNGIVRGYVKWDYELRSNDSIHQVVQRAFQIASHEPSGPVYLSLPQDLLAESISEVYIPEVNRFAAASTPQADFSLLEAAASALMEAQNPLLITGYSGRNLGSVAALVDLAESLSLRVIDAATRMDFPTTHPLYSGFDPDPYLKDADVILVIDNDVPYIPSRLKPAPDAKIIHIDIDPLKENLPMWGFPVDIFLQADSAKALPVLNRIIDEKTTPEMLSRRQNRFQQIQEEHRRRQEQWHQLALKGSTQKPISPDWLCYCINEAIDEDTIVTAEPVTNRLPLLRQLQRSRPGTYFQSGGSNLGWGLGAAYGAKLANPEKTVVSFMGDGGFVFGCPTASLWAANACRVPFLIVIFNNMRYNAPSLALRHNSGRESYSAQTGNWIGINIQPSPDYAAIARACGVFGQKIEEPAEIIPSLKNALELVRGGQPVVLDVRVDHI